MVGIFNQHAELLLRLLALAGVAGLGLPLLLAPLRWARWLRWRIPEEPQLATYFGRCLGALLCGLAAAAWIAAAQPPWQPLVLLICAAAFTLLVLVHAWGAWRRIQPAAASWLTLVWLGLLLLTGLVWP